MKITKSIKLHLLALCSLGTLSFEAQSVDVDQAIQALMSQPASLNQGREQFLQHCAGCHKKDLSGSVGFNLKDGEWVHGGKPSQILSSIQQGFDQAGMPAFAKILDESVQLSIVAYILSKREGFAGLTYNIYQLESAEANEFTDDDLIVSGKLANNIADFELPEVPHYAIQFSGDFYAPKNEKSHLFSEQVKNLKIDLVIDSEKIKPVAYGAVKKWLLKKGKQHLTLTFYSGKANPYLRNIPLYVVNDDNSIKLFPVSSKALADSKNTSFDVLALGGYQVQQKKIVKLPAYSIAVGAPDKINYAFNTKTCAINGLWQGDLLNVGPNIGGRGKDGSIPLGDWIYHFPQQLLPAVVNTEVESKASCALNKYRINDGAPEFHFTLNGLSMVLTTDFSRKNQATFIYSLLKNPNKLSELSFTLPSASALTVSSEQGQLQDKQMLINIDAYSNFSINMDWSGDKK